MWPICDYLHDDDRDAEWFLQGESGEFYICDECYQSRKPENQRGWVRMKGEAS